ncbi:HAD family hydrolase [Nitrincola iocasae]|uniref:HAD family hydrolase n=1 Tax=Nitrincola iocasae TaxID=2614693 RepID=UPI001784A466|nr:HAD-IA family hydrolase [Nitrincola iocasae]
MKDTIMLDLDGVIRHWSDVEVNNAERELGIAVGTLYSFASSQELSSLATIGAISHDEWCGRIRTALSSEYDENIAEQLVSAWYTASCEIDFTLLDKIKRLAPMSKLVLVTNATSRLTADLDKVNLLSRFDVVVNSSTIGVAKPDPKFFEKALALSESQAAHTVFVDDKLSNVHAASSLGIESFHHQSVVDTLEFIRKRFTSTAV